MCFAGFYLIYKSTFEATNCNITQDNALSIIYTFVDSEGLNNIAYVLLDDSKIFFLVFEGF
jgi:hypothetical protein